MNRAEFLEQLTKMYPNSFNQNNLQIWMTGYKKVLKENWDFERLFDYLLTEYTSVHTAPAPAWFNQYKSLVEPKKINNQNLEDLKRGAVPPPKKFLELKNKLKEEIQNRQNKMKEV